MTGASLADVARFAESLRHASWFAGVGQELTAAERAEAAEHMAALGRSADGVAAVATWREAEAALRDPAWDRAWWDAEEAERQRLLAAATAAHGEDALLAALSHATAEASDVVLGAAALAAARSGVADESLARVAAGAATQAAYHAALAIAAGEGPQHAFAIKFRLFAAGRWPLGLAGGRCLVF